MGDDKHAPITSIKKDTGRKKTLSSMKSSKNLMIGIPSETKMSYEATPGEAQAIPSSPTNQPDHQPPVGHLERFQQVTRLGHP